VVARNQTRGTVLAGHVEIAQTLWARFMGLMGRAALMPGNGLWLTGTNGIHMFFMRFAIDAVFLGRPDPDGDRVVLAARRALRPWVSLVPLVRGADGCLELPPGTIEATGTVEGDTVRIE
jgi:hypothetical protein